MSNDFDPDLNDVAPDVPSDRAWALEAVDTISSHNQKIEDLIRNNPVPWSSRIKGRKFTDKSANHLMDQIEWAGLVIEQLVKQIEKIVPAGHAAFPRTLGEGRELLVSVATLAACHKEATLVARMEQLDADETSALVEEIKHHRATLRAYLDAIVSDSPLGDETRRLVLAAEEAATLLRETFNVGTRDEAEAEISRLVGQEDDIKRHVRRLTVLATRLNLPDATLDDLAAFSRACALAKTKDPELLEAMRDVRPETIDIIDRLAQKVAKIKHASALLDDKFGPGWRSESVEKVSRASAIASTPGDPRHRKVADYAKTFGVNMQYPSSLKAVVNTRIAMDEMEKDTTLQRALPNTFKGLDTDFALLGRAKKALREFERILDARHGADKLLAVLTSNSRAVAEDFIALSGLDVDAAALPYPGDTPLREVRLRHEQKKADIVDAVKKLDAMPTVDQVKTTALARKVGRMLREIDAADKRISSNTLLLDANSPQPDDILAALEWKEKISSVLPDGLTPKNDEGFAQLLVVARQTLDTIMEWSSAIKDVRDLLDIEDLPDDTADLLSIQSRLQDIRAIEPVVHAQVGLCIAMERAMSGGLGPFITKCGAVVPVASWHDHLVEDYKEVDRIAAEEIFATELLRAAEDAASIQFDETMAIPPPHSDNVGSNPSNMGEWIEEEVVRQISLPIVANPAEVPA